jgi:transposase, IS5 family
MSLLGHFIPPATSRCPLVDQILQGQGQGGYRSQGSQAGRSRHPDVRLQRGNEPVWGTGEARSIDKAHGLIRTWDASAANAHDGARLPVLISKANTGSGVWADTAYRPKKNEAFLTGGMFTSYIHQRRKPQRPLPERIARANTRRSKVRAQVEHVFAGQKHRMGLVVRTIGIARATIKIGMANLAYNFQRLAWLEGRTAPA